MNNKRDDAFSIFKGIGIILMVIGHASCPLSLRSFIYLFHMSLFYFASGFFFKDKNIEDKTGFIKKRLKRLYLPYVEWTLLFAVFHNLFYELGMTAEYYGFQKLLVIVTKKILYFYGHSNLLVPIWFLRSLFITSILFCLIKFLAHAVSGKHENRVLFLFVVAAYAFGLYSIHFKLGIFLFKEDRDMAVMIVYYLGYLFAKEKGKIPVKWFIALLVLAFLIYASTFVKIELAASDFYNPFLFILLSACGCYLIYYVSSLISRHGKIIRRFLVYAGDNSMQILVLHLLSFRIVTAAVVYVFRLYRPGVMQCFSVAGIPGLWIAYTFIGTAVPLLLLRFYQYIKENIFRKAGMAT